MPVVVCLCQFEKQCAKPITVFCVIVITECAEGKTIPVQAWTGT